MAIPEGTKTAVEVTAAVLVQLQSESKEAVVKTTTLVEAEWEAEPVMEAVELELPVEVALEEEETAVEDGIAVSRWNIMSVMVKPPNERIERVCKTSWGNGKNKRWRGRVCTYRLSRRPPYCRCRQRRRELPWCCLRKAWPSSE